MAIFANDYPSVRLQLTLSMCRSVYDSVRPLHLLSKLVGFTLFSLDTKTRRVYFRKTDGFLAVLHLILLVALNCLYWNTYFVFKVHSSEVMKAFFPALAYTNYIMFNCAKVWTFCHRNSFGELLELIHEIDGDLVELGFQFDYKRQRQFVVKLILSLNLVEVGMTLIVYGSTEYYNIGIGWDVFIFTSFGFISNMTLINQFLTSVYGVNLRYKAINAIIG